MKKGKTKYVDWSIYWWQLKEVSFLSNSEEKLPAKGEEEKTVKYFHFKTYEMNKK